MAPLRYSIDRGFIRCPAGWSLDRLVTFTKFSVPFIGTRLTVYLPEKLPGNSTAPLIQWMSALYSCVELVADPLLDFRVYTAATTEDPGSVELVETQDQSNEVRDAVDMSRMVFISPSCVSTGPQESLPKYPKLLIAGTFDHLHSGHKLILSISALHATEELFVGFAQGEALLGNKKFKSALQCLEARQEQVRDFLDPLVSDGISSPKPRVTFLTTLDAIGPSATLDFDAIAVTLETRAGAEIVNSARVSAGKEKVEILELPLVMEAKSKASSTSIRKTIIERCGVEYGGVKEEWLRLGNESIGVCTDEPLLELWWEKLSALYSEPWRSYHSLRHVAELLKSLKAARQAQDRVTDLGLKLAVFFHDAVYRPWCGDNEQKSVDLFKKFWVEIMRTLKPITQDLDEFQASVFAEIFNFVCETILATQRHIHALKEPQCSPSIRAFLELDLQILASDRARYEEYAQGIRKEYEPVLHEPKDYPERRISFLNEMLPSLKSGLVFFDAALNDAAVSNIEWEIQNLRAT